MNTLFSKKLISNNQRISSLISGEFFYPHPLQSIGQQMDIFSFSFFSSSLHSSNFGMWVCAVKALVL